MKVIEAVFGGGLVLIMLWDSFEAVILPRRVRHLVRAARLFYLVTWRPWRALGRRFRNRRRREGFLSYYGPLSLLGLLVLWGTGIILGYGLIYLSIGAVGHLRDGLYVSGSSFTTLGLAGLPPGQGSAKLLLLLESGTGFGFLALVISYLPLLHQTFSRREAQLVMLDEWAGSPTAAVVLLERLGEHPREEITAFLQEWERWAAEILESHLSYPVLAYFRSQHDNQSWLGALTAILDVSAIGLSGLEREKPYWPARRAFAMARHAAVDLCLVLNTPPGPRARPVLSEKTLETFHSLLARGTTRVAAPDRFGSDLEQWRLLYEPYIGSLSRHLLMDLPSLEPDPDSVANWEVTAWDRSPRRRLSPRPRGKE
jgi:hypothetical protein